MSQEKTETVDLHNEEHDASKNEGAEHTVNEENVEQSAEVEETTDEEAAAEKIAEEEASADESADEVNITELQSELAAVKQEVEQLKQQNLRAQADFDNFRRRTRLEKEELQKYAAQRVLQNLLPVIDNFERAIESAEETKDFDALVKGLNMTYTQLMQVLQEEDLKQIEAVGQPFNPEFHQAVMQVESEEHEEGIIVEELQKGYMLKEKVLRPSMVKVSK